MEGRGHSYRETTASKGKNNTTHSVQYSLSDLRWDFIKENKKENKKEDTLSIKKRPKNGKEKVFRVKNINQFVDSTKLNISKNKCLILICVSEKGR